jgi:peptide/nickel transport system permease protein
MSSPKGLTALALQKFKKNIWGVFSLGIMLVIAFLAVFAYALAPDNSQYANQMHVSIHSKPPGFKVKILSIPHSKKSLNNPYHTFFFGKIYSDKEIPITDYYIKNNLLYYAEYPTNLSDAILSTVSLNSLSNGGQDAVRERCFYLGTDKYGRDLLSRVLIGARISFFIGFIAVAISIIIGLGLGSIAGYFGGKIDAFIMWIISVTWSIPTLLLVIAITLALGKGFWQVFVAVGLTMWVEVARVVRGQVIGVKEMQYVTAAKALGYSDIRIIIKHIIPNILAPVIVISAANFAAAILIESGLSFLGIGAQPPMSSWGAMIKDHYNYIILGKAYLAVIPGFCIMVLVLSVMMFGNALRDALDVRV